jgi:hypothetical protein
MEVLVCAYFGGSAQQSMLSLARELSPHFSVTLLVNQDFSHNAEAHRVIRTPFLESEMTLNPGLSSSEGSQLMQIQAKAMELLESATVLSELESRRFSVICTTPLPADTALAGYLQVREFRFALYGNDPDLTAFFELPTQAAWNEPYFLKPGQELGSSIYHRGSMLMAQGMFSLNYWTLPKQKDLL